MRFSLCFDWCHVSTRCNERSRNPNDSEFSGVLGGFGSLLLDGDLESREVMRELLSAGKPLDEIWMFIVNL